MQSFILLRLAATVLTALPTAHAKIQTKQLALSWLFDWTPIDQVALPAPITAQCETLNIKWSRSSATGPDGVAPYSIQLYKSGEHVPLLLDAGNGLNMDLVIPFPTNTQYMACMFDSKGSTGGCQNLFTVYPTIDPSTGQAPSCSNITFPNADLSVDMTKGKDGGALSEFGFIDQCSEVLITPKTGTPPFILTVASPLHPPLNITSDTMDPISWHVNLDWGTAFFLSLVDSKGLTWAAGPLHGGGPGNQECFGSQSGKKDVGSIVGALFGGIALGGLLFLAALLGQRRYSQRLLNTGTTQPMHQSGEPQPSLMASNPFLADSERAAGNSSPQFVSAMPTQTPAAAPSDSLSATVRSPSTTASPVNLPRLVQHIEPFPLPSAGSPPRMSNSTSPRLKSRPSASSTASGTVPAVPLITTSPSTIASFANSSTVGEVQIARQIYVVHVDGGDVVELPPTYKRRKGEDAQ